MNNFVFSFCAPDRAGVVPAYHWLQLNCQHFSDELMRWKKIGIHILGLALEVLQHPAARHHPLGQELEHFV